MDCFSLHCYKINRFYFKYLGMLPQNNVLINRIKRMIIFSIFLSFFIPQFIKIIEELKNDIDIVIEASASVMYLLTCMVKYLNYIFNESQMERVFKKIAEHWKVLTSSNDIKLLEKFGKIGHKSTLQYLIFINTVVIIYLSLPFLPILFDVIAPLNETRPLIFPYYAEYFIDIEKYYFELSFHVWIVLLVSVQLVIGFDSMYLQYVQHSSALFSIVRQNLFETAKLTSSNEFATVKERDDYIYNNMINAVILHKDTIKFVNTVEDSFSTSLLIVVILNTLIISLIAVDTALNIEKNNWMQVIRISVLYTGYLFHLFNYMNIGQKLIDTSIEVQYAAYDCDWFYVSPKTKKLLYILMLRSNIPCQLTAGKIIIINFENFTSIFKKSLSYITLFSSLR